MVSIRFLALLLSFYLYLFDNYFYSQDSLPFLGTKVSSPPVFKKSKNSTKLLFDFIHQNLRYPESAIRDSIEGKVYVSFIVDESGYTKNHKVVKGIRFDLDSEAIRVSRLLRFEEPAMVLKGKTVSFNYILPITFTIHPIEKKEKKSFKKK